MESICNLKNIYKALYQFEKAFSETQGITINEGVVLCCMKDNKPRTANELCDYVGLSNSRVSRVINSVELKGLIHREIGAEDKRLMIFTLTEKGKAKVEEMQKHKFDFSKIKEQIINLIEQ